MSKINKVFSALFIFIYLFTAPGVLMSPAWAGDPTPAPIEVTTGHDERTDLTQHVVVDAPSSSVTAYNVHGEGASGKLIGNSSISTTGTNVPSGSWMKAVSAGDGSGTAGTVTFQNADAQQSNVNINASSQGYTSQAATAYAHGTMNFNNTGKTTITATGNSGTNAVVAHGTTNFNGGNVLINSYVDGGVADTNVIGVIGYGAEGGAATLNVSSNVDTFKIQTVGAGYIASTANASDGTAAIDIIGEGTGTDGNVSINSNKFIVDAKAGEAVELKDLDGKTIANVGFNASEYVTKGETYNSIAGIRTVWGGQVHVGSETDTTITTTATNSEATSANPLKSFGIYNAAVQDLSGGGIVEILGNTTVTSTGGEGTYSVYTADGGKTVLGSEGKTVSLTGDVMVKNGGELQVNGSTDTINGRVTIDGSESTATLNNLTMTDQSTTSNGGAIYNEGTLTVNNATFERTTTTAGGGAIYDVAGSSMTLKSVDFANNSADWGGAIVARGKMSITGGSFTGDYSNDGGGAIYLTTLANKGHTLSY